ncbi:hypothetical protein PTI98_011201 [Pleurotus ostreatus]|nr:hypothetical protein PTI98_011201 [Pleurotus ostreatus]
MHGLILMNFDSHRQPRVQPAFLYEGQGRKDIMSPNLGQPQNWLASKAPSTRFKVPLDAVHAALVGSIINMHRQVVKSSIAQFNRVSLADVISGVRPVLRILLPAQRHVPHGKVSTRRSLVVTWTDGIVVRTTSFGLFDLLMTLLAITFIDDPSSAAAPIRRSEPGIPTCTTPRERACPVYRIRNGVRTQIGHKCQVISNDLWSCGGCPNDDREEYSGKDCTEIRNADSVQCIKGQCVVHSCIAGHTRSEDHAACISMAAHEGLVEQSLPELTKDWDLY